ncbi:MAG: hypothetical protein JW810_06860 [Sedimentisphaerales bacterium]|nr:hypothetical protein [Sedimentisphaerales bacterium]
MMDSERLLLIFLRIFAGVALIALVPACMPFAWMDAVHRFLGLGPLPDLPITSYLARSLSGFYAVYGALLLYLSFSLRRFLDVIRVLLGLGLLFGIGLLGIDCTAGLPWYWIVCEGPLVIGLCGGLLYLAGRVKKSGLALPSDR